MSPPQSTKSWNIAIMVTIALAAGGVIHKLGQSEEKLDSVAWRLDKRDAKDEMQDLRIGGLEVRAAVMESDVREIKAREPKRTPVFPSGYQGSGIDK